MIFPERGRGMTDFFYIDGDYGLSNSQKQICYIKRCNVIWDTKNKGIFISFLTKEIGNLDTKIAKEKNLKTKKFSPAQLWLVQFLGNPYPKIIRSFSQRQNPMTSAKKKLCWLETVPIAKLLAVLFKLKWYNKNRSRSFYSEIQGNGF